MQWITPRQVRFALGTCSIAVLPAAASSQTEVFEFRETAADCCLGVGRAGDLNHDGKTDVFVTGATPGMAVHSGFNGSTLVRCDADLTAVSIGDVNGDGVPDLCGGNTLTVYSGASGLPLFQVQSSGGSLSDVAATGDLNGDGVRDMASTRKSPNQVVTVSSGANGTQIWSIVLYPGATGQVPLCALGRDVDGDGVEDFTVGGLTNSGVGFKGFVRLLSGATGSTIWEALGTGFGAGAFPSDLATIGDLNQDGSPDIAVLFQVVEVLDGQTGAFFPSFAPPIVGTALDSAGDINGDGLSDLVVGNTAGMNQFGASTGTVSVYSLTTGARLWSSYGEAPGEGFGSSVAGLGDITGDGVPDVAAGSSNGGVARVLSGTLLPHGLSVPTGVGCSTTGYTPALTASAPTLGATFTTFVTGARPSAPVWLLFSPIPSSATPLPTGCFVYLKLGPVARFASGVTSSSGTWVQNSAIPYIPSLIGLELATQAVVFETGTELTNGLHLLVGL